MLELYGTISSIGGGARHTINQFNFEGGNIRVFQHIVESGDDTLTTFTFDCYPQATEAVIPDYCKEKLEPYFKQGVSISNGAISITNDGTTMKLINSSPSENVHQQGTFTFYGVPGGGLDPD